MNKKVRSSRLFILSLIILNLTIILISLWYYEVEKETFINQKIDQLNAIAEIKINQVTDWRNERLSDANYLSVSPQINESFRLLLAEPANAAYRKLLYDNLNGMFLNGKYESMVAMDQDGNAFFSLPENDTTAPDHFKNIDLSDKYPKVRMSDIMSGVEGNAIIEIIIPQFKIARGDTIHLGFLGLNINLEKTFLRLLEALPIPSESMEISLVYKDGNNVIHHSQTGLTEKRTIDLKNLKGKSLPVSGLSSAENGYNLQGKRVLAISQPLPNSRSFLLVRMDRSEAYADVRKLEFSIGAFAGLMILAITSAISFFWLKQRNEVIILESEKKLLLERFDMLSKFANDAIIVYTRDLTVLQVNDKALELYGYTKEELLGMSADLLRIPELRAEIPFVLEKTMNEGGYRFDTVHLKKDGSRFPVEVSIRFMELMGSPCFQALVRDITQRKQFEKALITGEERLRLITNTMPQIVWTTRPDGSFDFVNSRFELLTGLYPLKENLSADFIHEQDQDRVISYWRKAVHDVREHQISLRVRMKDGSFRWFLCIAIPMCNDAGDVIRWYGSATDIDELENRVEQRTSELSDLYNNAPIGYHSLDMNGTFIKINDTALNWLGYTREELIGTRNFADLITEESRDRFFENFKLFKNLGYVNNLEYEMVRKDGTILPVLLSATAVRDEDGKMIMTRSTTIDHTVRKHHENEIMKLNASLQEHGYNLEYANKELEAFIFSVSHDLRAPLRAINGFSQILLDDYKSTLDPEGQILLNKVWGNSNRMRQLIDDLLRLSRTGRQELTYARIDMRALFNSMIEEARQTFPDRTVHVNMNSMPAAYGDLALLKQVISNLLSNAVKFSGKKDRSEIEIGSILGEKEMTYYVKDNGTGFDMKFSHELFGVFRRLNNAEDYEGTGVGLALVKRIIDKHGGRVWAYSEPAKGATFYFSLPANKVV